MGRNSGGTRSASARAKHTGPGFTEPVRGPKTPSSAATEIQYVYVDKLTGGQSDGFKSLDAVKTAISRAERDDKRSGVFEEDSYYIERVENIKGQGRSQYYRFGK